MESENENKRSLLEIVKELAETSSLHGVPKIASSRQLAVKILWCILFLAAVGVMTYQLLELFRTFYSNPVQTTVSLDFSTLQFPAITICNMNPVRKSKLGLSPDLLNKLFPKKSISQRRKRNSPDISMVSGDIPESQPSYFETRVVEVKTTNGRLEGDTMDALLAKYNVNTIEELMKLFGNPSVMANETSPVTWHKVSYPNGSYVFTYRSTTKPDISDASFWDTVTKSAQNNFTEIINRTTSYRDYLNDTLATFLDRFDKFEISPPEFPLNISNISDVFSTDLPSNLSEIFPTEIPYWMDNLYEFDWDIFQSFDTEATDNYSTSELEFPKPLADHFQDPKDKWDLVKTDFKTTFRSVDIEARKNMGHQLNDFIQYASFAKRQQNIPSNFEEFTTSDFGNCYTMDNSKYKAWRSGPETGIKLTLYLEVDEYVESYSSGYGVRIVFHEPGTFPMPAEEGLTINPGYETSISLRAINVTRLGEPYGHCTLHGSEQFRKKYNVTYSKTACFEFCRIENVIDLCKCLPIDAPDIDFRANVPVCQSKDEVCVFEVQLMFEDGRLHCDCINPCTEFVYAKTISGRFWPHRDYMEKVLMKDMCGKNLDSLEKACQQLNSNTEDFDYERYRNNFVRLLIYFEDLNYQKITEEPFYTTVRFICDIGGAMGLFIGVSLLSLFEVLQLMLEIVLYLLDKRRNKPNKNGLVEKNNMC